MHYTWNHDFGTKLSKYMTIGGRLVVYHVRTSLDREFRAPLRAAVQATPEKSETQGRGLRVGRTPPEKAENHQVPLGGAGLLVKQ